MGNNPSAGEERTERPGRKISQSPEVIRFGPYRLDLDAEQLTRGTEPVRLRPKTWAVLGELARRPGQLISNDELLDSVWGNSAVVPKVLTNCIRELRQVLGDPASSPRLIETVHRRGYRFIAEIGTPDSIVRSSREFEDELFVGRETELQWLSERWQNSLEGKRQIAFIAGEAGIGKTTLASVFRDSLAAEPIWVARGNCIEQRGKAEAYFPVLEAMNALASGPKGAELRELLSRFGPSWLSQLPGLRPAKPPKSEGDDLRHVRPERMLREGAVLLEAISEVAPLLLILEDLQWADASTLELLSLLAARSTPARLLVLATYRPAEAIAHGHPIVPTARRLRDTRQGAEHTLEPLSESSLRLYLGQRFDSQIAVQVADIAGEQSGGNPLFLRLVTDHYASRGWVRQETENWILAAELDTLRDDLPPDLRSLIAAHLDGLTRSEVEIIGAASVCGDLFTPSTVADALEVPTEEVETICQRLATRRRLVRATSQPTDSVEQYAFVHSIYRRVVYDGLTKSVRVRLHQQIAESLERGSPERAEELASQLAFHFAAAGDSDRAAHHYQRAAQNSVLRFAYRAAEDALRSALDHLSRLPGSRDRNRREARAQIYLATMLQVQDGFGVPEALPAQERARDLYEAIDHPAGLVRTLLALAATSINTGAIAVAKEASERAIAVAEARVHPQRAMAHGVRGVALLSAGEFVAGVSHLERSLDFEPAPDPIRDVSTFLTSQMAYGLALVGDLRQAGTWKKASLARAEQHGTPTDQAYANLWAAMTAAVERDPQSMLRLSERVLVLDDDYGVPLYAVGARILQSCALAATSPSHEHLADMRRALEKRLSQSELWYTSGAYAAMIEGHMALDDVRGADTCVDEGLEHVAATGERVYLAELHRYRGELRRAQSRDEAAEPSFHRAIAIARQQGARLFELRASLSLARLLCAHDRSAEAQAQLGPACEAIRFDGHCPEVKAAQSLLDGERDQKALSRGTVG